jgi:hypothetical protein
VYWIPKTSTLENKQGVIKHRLNWIDFDDKHGSDLSHYLAGEFTHGFKTE